MKIFFNEITKEIDFATKQLLELSVDNKFHQIVAYQNSTGGKRLRPILTIISSKIFGGEIKDVLYPAAGLEILHNCTLIVDDIIDHSKLRRNKPTVWSAFGKSVAECVGLDYLASAFSGAIRSKKPKTISKIFSETLKTIVNGEIYDILFEQKGRDNEPYIVKNRYLKIEEGDYYRMVAKKTAFLFQSSCYVGGICANAGKKQLEYLKKYGFNLGMAFQIQDDVLDIFGDEKKFGKKIGKDIEERKLGNIVILFALKELSEKDKNEMIKIFQKNSIDDEDIRKTIKIIEKTNSRQKALALIESFLEKAKENLKFLPKNKWNKILEDFTDSIAKRDK